MRPSAVARDPSTTVGMTAGAAGCDSPGYAPGQNGQETHDKSDDDVAFFVTENADEKHKEEK